MATVMRCIVLPLIPNFVLEEDASVAVVRSASLVCVCRVAYSVKSLVMGSKIVLL